MDDIQNEDDDGSDTDDGDTGGAGAGGDDGGGDGGGRSGGCDVSGVIMLFLVTRKKINFLNCVLPPYFFHIFSLAGFFLLIPPYYVWRMPFCPSLLPIFTAISKSNAPNFSPKLPNSFPTDLSAPNLEFPSTLNHLTQIHSSHWEPE